jgi:hypothetical protein
VKSHLAGACLLAAFCLSGCSMGIGQTCNASTPCPSDLVCSYPPVDGGTAANGVCDYPLKAEGKPCTVAAECDSSLTCSNHFTPNNRYGKCVPKLAAGAACFRNRDCQSNRCNGADGVSLSGTCG